MNGPTRAPLSLSTTRRTYVSWTNSPATSIGERSPCGALLQLVAAMRLWLQSVAGSRLGPSFGKGVGNNVTPASHDCVANFYGRTPAGGQFGWGGTLLKRYREGPKVGSSGSETNVAWPLKLPSTTDICEQMPETIYAAAEDDFHKELWRKLLKKGTVREIAHSLQLSSKQMYRWKEGEACYPLSAFNKLCGLVGYRPRLAYIRTRRDSAQLFQPRVEQELNEEFSEFLGHLLHDGGIDSDWRVHYTSNDENLLDRFRELIETCFGHTHVKSRMSGAATTLYYPAIIGMLLGKNLGLPKGSKVLSNISIPKSIKKRLTKRNLIVPYVAAAYLCDGESGRARIAIASKEVSSPPNLLRDLRDLLMRLNYKSIRITPSSMYKTQHGVHRRWVLNLKEKQEKKRLLQMIRDYRLLHRLDIQS